MEIVRIRQVKKQIRVLGLAARRLEASVLVFGAVYRGRLGLDGVLSASCASPDVTDAAAAMIRASPHINQVRVIAVDTERLPPGVAVDLAGLARGTGKPVLGLSRGGGTLDERYMFTWRGRTVTSVGLGRGDAERVLETCSFDGVPEALRVASLAADGVSVPGLHKV